MANHPVKATSKPRCLPAEGKVGLLPILFKGQVTLCQCMGILHFDAYLKIAANLTACQ